MNELLILIGEYFASKDIFSFGDEKADGFIDQLPQGRINGVVITETTKSQQENAFGNRGMSYDRANIGIYVYANSMAKGRELSDAIYAQMRAENTMGSKIFSVQPDRPVFIDNTQKEQFVYLVELTCFIR